MSVVSRRSSQSTSIPVATAIVGCLAFGTTSSSNDFDDVTRCNRAKWRDSAEGVKIQTVSEVRCSGKANPVNFATCFCGFQIDHADRRPLKGCGTATGFRKAIVSSGALGNLQDCAPAAQLVRVGLGASEIGPRATASDAKPPPDSNIPALAPSQREAAERLVARGKHELEQGRIAVARQLFLLAAEAGLGRGALFLGFTYDPNELARWPVLGVKPDVAQARKWYDRARELGVVESAEHLQRLQAPK
jgi:hypothetical protein